MSLFDNDQYMRKANKAALGTLLKDLVTTVECTENTCLVIDGGWLLHQGSFKSGETYG